MAGRASFCPAAADLRTRLGQVLRLTSFRRGRHHLRSCHLLHHLLLLALHLHLHHYTTTTTAAAAFSDFMQSADVAEVHAAFERLLRAVSILPPGSSPGSHSLEVFRSLVRAGPACRSGCPSWWAAWSDG